MLSCVASKLTLFCHSRPPTSINNFRECITLLNPKTDFSTSSNLLDKPDGPQKWLAYNNVIYPPQEPGEERRPSVCYFSNYFLYSCVTKYFVVCSLYVIKS